jgi:uncharacterized protein YndB with AHSA1/START domain
MTASPVTDSKAAANAVVTECDLPDAPEKVWNGPTAPELLAARLGTRRSGVQVP